MRRKSAADSYYAAAELRLFLVFEGASTGSTCKNANPLLHGSFFGDRLTQVETFRVDTGSITYLSREVFGLYLRCPGVELSFGESGMS